MFTCVAAKSFGGSGISLYIPKLDSNNEHLLDTAYCLLENALLIRTTGNGMGKVFVPLKSLCSLVAESECVEL